MELHTIGIDLGKTVFHLVGLNPCGEVVVRKKFSRKQLPQFTEKIGTLFGHNLLEVGCSDERLRASGVFVLSATQSDVIQITDSLVQPFDLPFKRG